jgi:UDP:flavonoid glycosyltransferase YjiC (YdhE family)
MAGVMHHGGSGTTHTGARAGVPQFIMPEIIDQYYWANRIFKMGLGPKPISSKKLTVEKLIGALKEITNESYRKNAAGLGERMKNEDGVKEVVKAITGS